MNIGIVLPNWIGDVVMATPALRALRRHFGVHATLTGIVRPYAKEVLAGLPWLDEHLLYDPRSSDRALSGGMLVRNLRKRKLDTIVLLTNSLRTAVVAWLSGVKQRVGYVRSGRGPFLTTKLHPPKRGRWFVPISAVDYYLELVYSLGCPEESRKAELATTLKDEQAADSVWHKFGLNRASRVVTMNSGGAYGAAKHWKPEYFAELAKRMIRDSGTAVLMLCGPNERAAAAQIARLVGDPRMTSLAQEDLSIGLSKACVKRSQLLISTDSGPRHFAAGFDVPSVALFGPTDPQWSWNYHSQEVVVRQELPCSPCSQRVCSLGHHQCMQTLTPEQVFCVVQHRRGHALNSRVA